MSDAGEAVAVIQGWLDDWTARHGAGHGERIPFKHSAEPEPGLPQITIGHLRALVGQVNDLEADRDEAREITRAFVDHLREISDLRSLPDWASADPAATREAAADPQPAVGPRKCATCDASEDAKPLTFELPQGAGLLCRDCAKPVIESTRALEELSERKKARST